MWFTPFHIFVQEKQEVWKHHLWFWDISHYIQPSLHQLLINESRKWSIDSFLMKIIICCRPSVSLYLCLCNGTLWGIPFTGVSFPLGQMNWTPHRCNDPLQTYCRWMYNLARASHDSFKGFCNDLQSQTVHWRRLWLFITFVMYIDYIVDSVKGDKVSKVTFGFSQYSIHRY